MIRRSAAVRTFDDWNDPAPGFMEANLMAHSGPTAKASYVQTLTLTDMRGGQLWVTTTLYAEISSMPPAQGDTPPLEIESYWT